MAKMYAWSEFRIDVDEHNKAKKVVHVGEEVTAEKLKVSKDEFDSMIEVGVVREQPYPPVAHEYQSPTEYFKELSAKAGGGALTGDEMQTLSEYFNANMAQGGLAPPPEVEEAEGTASAGK